MKDSLLQPNHTATESPIMAKTKGFVIHRGLSPIDGQPIVAILTLESSNRKTGNMAQVWILRSDVNPVEAINSGADISICGGCGHRKQADGSRSCYVNVGQAPNSVFKTFKAGGYINFPSNDQLRRNLKGRKIRWGAYGDPAMLPVELVLWINHYAVSHTGYTHQWRREFASSFIGVFQASCDGFADYLDATAEGWHTFTVVGKHAQPTYAKQCPATVENSQAQCLTCSLCDGAKTNIFVHAHGSGAKHVVAA